MEKLNKMSIEDFITEYNYLCTGAEPQSQEIVKDLYSEVSEMFLLNVGEIPEFELTNGGRTIILIK